MGFAETFKALSDPVRREILNLLKEGEWSAGEIAKQFDLAQASVSYHLNILKKANLIEENKVKNFIYYEINTSVLEDVMVWLSDLRGDKNNENQ
ncbi:transcriptional regulator [Streptococcus bovimastitidis]|uniref:Transcriptional regulator n=1 Tax=Streptococcus bovimastitidis TaxID=1856638 RepID=A0A1L8MQ29_9STRE|nr:autorepressor SdpR family transcription factor [Streptococcus bovimastitidis]OJF72863.1 transcriptional regulator [Streptococcus bovimastitidis]